MLGDSLPNDPVMLMSFINMKLRDEYPDGLMSLCEDMGIEHDELIAKLASAGFEYSAENNCFW